MVRSTSSRPSWAAWVKSGVIGSADIELWLRQVGVKEKPSVLVMPKRYSNPDRVEPTFPAPI